MNRNQTHHRGRVVFVSIVLCLALAGLSGRLFFLMIVSAEYYSEMAEDLHQRERSIKAARGRILDRNGVVIADNRTVCTISVVHNQITDPEEVIAALSGELDLSEEEIRKKVEKYSAREIIKTNVDKADGDRIRKRKLSGVKVDE
ncbi:MAG: peptidoglycan glycosyltransferase, partial [Clostridiaceae bacterium]|nr:peptidoglycan glycosyltransferase [Clostridiaceae bacterium]